MVVEVIAENQTDFNERLDAGDYLIIEDFDRQLGFEEID